MRRLIVTAGGGLSVENPVGGILTFKVTTEESGGTVTALDTVAAPGEGPPLHVHDQDEVIYTLEGTFRVKLDDTLQEVPPYSCVYIPRGTPHTWQNIGAEPARFFASIIPATAAFEEFFKRYAELPAEQRGLDAFARLAAETNAFQVVGPPLAESDPL